MFFFLFFTIKLLIEFLSYKAETNKSKPKHQNIEDNKFRQFFFSLSKLSLFFFFFWSQQKQREVCFWICYCLYIILSVKQIYNLNVFFSFFFKQPNSPSNLWTQQILREIKHLWAQLSPSLKCLSLLLIDNRRDIN